MNKIIFEDIKSIAGNSALMWEKLKGKRVLITGATGFLAYYMIKVMLYRNKIYGDKISVVALCRNKKKAEVLYGENITEEKMEFIYQDVTDKIKIKGTVDYIIHTASPASTYACVNDPWGTISANINGFHQILECAKQNNAKRVMFFSSYVVYGEEALNKKPDEQSSCVINIGHGIDIYAISKILCEALGNIYAERCEVVSVRPSIIYGPGDALSRGRLMTDFISNYINGEPIVLKSNGLAKRNFVYVKDAVVAFFIVLFNGKNKEAYNIASDEEISVLELADLFCDLKGSKGRIFAGEVKEQYLQNTYSIQTADNLKIKNLGWGGAQVSLEDGIRRTIRWAQNSEYFHNW